MASSTGPIQKVVPAKVAFLAIYNPSLGTTDDTLDDQIVYYFSARTRKNYHRRLKHGKSPPELSQTEKNERLRQIGLAQGMVEFGKSFSEGKSVDNVETQKSRIILHELEAGWWLLASIDLTRLSTSTKNSTSTPKNQLEIEDATVEYSSREVKPPALLLQDLLRAHSTFLLHHASSMSALFVRTRRSRFLNIIGRYWDAYLSTWNVMVHGNPIVNVYGGIKLAGSGELGMGVGEEDRGSGERAVLEGFVGRIEGLVDLVVSKFGDEGPEKLSEKGEKGTRSQAWLTPKAPWLGTGVEPTSEDGAIFLGVGALSRKSLQDVTHWMEDLYSWGSSAYGVAENPTSTRKSRTGMKNPTRVEEQDLSHLRNEGSPTAMQTRPISPRSAQGSFEATIRSNRNEPDQGKPQISPRELSENVISKSSADQPSVLKKQTSSKVGRPPLHRAKSSHSSGHSTSSKSLNVSKLASYFKLGYGTHWTLSTHSQKGPPELTDQVVHQSQLPSSHVESIKGSRPSLPAPIGSNDPFYPVNDSMGHFLVGLMGDVEQGEEIETDDDTTVDEATEESNFRTLLRTVTVELEREGDARAEADISIDLSTSDDKRHSSAKTGRSERTGTSATSYESQDRNKTKKLRIVVYVSRPFIFTFLFELRTDALALRSLYRALHHQLRPLHRPLLNSTKKKLSRPDITTTSDEEAKTPIYDLIWDPKLLTITSSIPNIPDPLQGQDAALKTPWPRLEAINTHIQLVNTFTSTRNDRLELERTCKTSRGWWVVWTRVPDPDTISITATAASTPRVGASTLQLPKEESVDTDSRGRTVGSFITRDTSRTGSTLDLSMSSGPAHPWLESSTPMVLVPKDKEIFLIRRASDYVNRVSTRFTAGTSSNQGGWGSGPAKLAQGIGVDTKRYIEGLLNMGQ